MADTLERRARARSRQRLAAGLFAMAAAASVVSLWTLANVHAQSVTAKPAEFEVASVKAHTDADRRTMMIVQPGGRFLAANVPLRLIVRSAFQLQDDQIVGGPDWLASERFDIDARSADTSGPPGGVPLLEMLQSLLSQRFAFAAHRETRELPVFAVERAGGSRSQAPGLKPTECPDLVVDLNRATPCANIRNGADFLALRGMPLAQFTQYLAPYVNRVLIDRSGLAERYDIDLRWTPETQAAAPDQGSAQPRPDADRPSLFTAIQEQLGLRLVPTRAMVEVLVIDNIERPTPN